MNYSEYFAIQEYIPESVSVSALTDKQPRTLVYGYDVQRNTFHVYLNEQGLLQRVLYDHDGFLIDAYESESFAAEDCIPEKRIYPAKSDFEFCKLLSRLVRRSLPFTTFDEVREPKQYYGKLKEDLVEANFRDFEVFVRVDKELADAIVGSVTPAEFQAPLRFAPQAFVSGRIEGILESMLERMMRNEKLGVETPDLLARLKSNVEWSLGTFLREQGFDSSTGAQSSVTVTDDVVVQLQALADAAVRAHREKLKVDA